jgi:hypothetical protein
LKAYKTKSVLSDHAQMVLKLLAFKEKINMKFLLDSSKALAISKYCEEGNWKEFRINK